MQHPSFLSRFVRHCACTNGPLVLLLASLFAPLQMASAQSVLTRHNDLARTGQNLSETTLNTSNVRTGQFGKLFSRDVDGEIYTQPLYVPGLKFGSITRNVVFVATAHNSVYAFDADDAALTGPLWKVSCGTAVPASVLNTYSLAVEVGIIGTPVIDAVSSTLYVVSKEYPTTDISTMRMRLHALELTTGAEKFGGPVEIQAIVDGIGDGNDGAGHIPFEVFTQLQRCALTLANGTVYIPFASHEDVDPYHGWVLGYDAKTLVQNGVHNNTPDNGAGGIWMAGDGMAVDKDGNLYYSGGNGDFDGNTDIAESIVKLSPTLATLDWFAPWNEAYLSSLDSDLSSSSVLLLPGTDYLVTGGKEGKIYVLNTRPGRMGRFHAGDDSQIVQEWQASWGQIFASLLYWNSPTNGPTLYVWGTGDYLSAFKFTGTYFQTTPFQQSTMQVTDGYANGPGMSLSANGSTAGTGIVWANLPFLGDATHDHVPAILRAFDAGDITHELWNSKMTVGDEPGSWGKWVPPTVVNGKVYLSTLSNSLVVYGLLPRTLSGTVLLDSIVPNASPQSIQFAFRPVSGRRHIQAYGFDRLQRKLCICR